jgi:hypothetical protein
MAGEQINNNHGDGSANRQYQQTNQDRDEEIVQVVYQSDQHGALVGVESTSLLGAQSGPAGVAQPDPEGSFYEGHPIASSNSADAIQLGLDQKEAAASQFQTGPLTATSYHEQLSRAGSTLPSVAEEPITSGAGLSYAGQAPLENNSQQAQADARSAPVVDDQAPAYSSDYKENDAPEGQATSFATSLLTEQTEGNLVHGTTAQQHHQYNNIETTQQQQAPIYSTIKRTPANRYDQQQQQLYDENQYVGEFYDGQQKDESVAAAGQQTERNENLIDYSNSENGSQQQIASDYYHQTKTEPGEEDAGAADQESGDPGDSATRINQEIGHILSRQRAGAGVEKGSFRNNFRKKLGISVSTNENDLTAYRQKLLAESSLDPNQIPAENSTNSSPLVRPDNAKHLGSLPSKFKRTHSVSFNVNSSRSNRHSVDIRNLPSYLTHKRASIVDVAKGAMSSLISSLGGSGDAGGGSGGGSGSGSAISASQKRDSVQEEPIFEEPIAPTLSLGQRVAMVRNVGAEFGTVGWIGQLPDVDDDWIVGVIFDNMIGDCDGAYNGVRYFYARPNYAMFVPLSMLTKTDNYIGRPETGTMLSRMSVSLKPGQLISIQRSSIRLQHCFLNAPHQRVGHDVRAVSNRLHCQCHNCGPCAHLTKQGRINALPHFGAHHLPHKKKNSLTHAAVEMLAHHHHHFHEEEEHEEKDYEFGDNAAHACNFVRYSCCQQRGTQGHEFSRDCEMVRPELLDNLIHAPKAPHRRAGRAARNRRSNQNQRPSSTAKPTGQIADTTRQFALEDGGATDGGGSASNTNTLDAHNQSTLDRSPMTGTLKSSEFDGQERADGAHHHTLDEGVGGDHDDSRSDQSSYYSSQGSSGSSSRSASPSQEGPVKEPYNYYQYDTSGFRPTSGVYNTINSQVSYLDQQRFVYQRDSSAMLHSPRQSNYSDDYDTSNYSENFRGPVPGFKRFLRCIGCIRRQPSGKRHRRHRRKLSFRDRVLEYRRRQSTFVPSTLAKPQEDFASHGIMLPHSSRHGQGAEINSDYSSCSHSSCSSNGSNSPRNYQDTAACLNNTIPMQTQDQHRTQANGFSRHTGSVAFEHEQSSTNDQLKSGQNYERYDHVSGAQLNYGDYTFGEGYQSYEKQEATSRDSAMTDLGYTNNTYKSNSSSDTLKHLVDQSVNEQVSPPQPLPANYNEMISPLSSASNHHQNGNHQSPQSEQFEVSSPTASAADSKTANEDCEQENLRTELDNLSL